VLLSAIERDVFPIGFRDGADDRVVQDAPVRDTQTEVVRAEIVVFEWVTVGIQLDTTPHQGEAGNAHPWDLADELYRARTRATVPE
jgi:hypothetical protein